MASSLKGFSTSYFILSARLLNDKMVLTVGVLEDISKVKFFDG